MCVRREFPVGYYLKHAVPLIQPRRTYVANLGSKVAAGACIMQHSSLVDMTPLAAVSQQQLKGLQSMIVGMVITPSNYGRAKVGCTSTSWILDTFSGLYTAG